MGSMYTKPNLHVPCTSSQQMMSTFDHLTLCGVLGILTMNVPIAMSRYFSNIADIVNILVGTLHQRKKAIEK